MSLDGLVPSHLAPAQRWLRIEGIVLRTSPPTTLDLLIEVHPADGDWPAAPLVARLKQIAAGDSLAPAPLARKLYDVVAARNGVRALSLTLHAQDGPDGAALAIVLASGSVRPHLPNWPSTNR